MWPCISYPFHHPSIEVKRGSEQGLNMRNCKRERGENREMLVFSDIALF
jgi:hypothetical protein